MCLYQCCLFSFSSLSFSSSSSLFLNVACQLCSHCCMLHGLHPTTPISSSPMHIVMHQCCLHQQLYRVLNGQSRSACRSLPRKCTSIHQQSCMLPKSLLAEVTGYDDNMHFTTLCQRIRYTVFILNTHMYTHMYTIIITYSLSIFRVHKFSQN